MKRERVAQGFSASWPVWAERAAFAALLVFSVYTAVARLGPDSASLPLFCSDSAVPVLMANDSRIDPFHIYFYGQDRFGAFPFVLASAARSLVNGLWSPEALAVLSALWLMSTTLVLRMFSKPYGFYAASAFLAIILVSPNVRPYMFELAQVYPWVIPLFFGSWVQVRRQTQNPTLYNALLSMCLMFMTLWTVSSFAALLGGVIVAESLAAYVSRANESPTVFPRLLKRLAPFLSLGAAVALEITLRAGYHLYAKNIYGHSYRTPLGTDFSHLLDNVQSITLHLVQSPAAALMALGAAAGVWSAVRLAQVWLRRAAGTQNTAVESHAIILGCAGAAFGQIVLLTMVAHFRLNLFDTRYFTMVEFCLTLGGVLGFSMWLHGIMLQAFRPLLPVAFTAGCAALVALAGPPHGSRPEYDVLAAHAELVGRHGRGTVLLADYWSSYVLAGRLPRLEIHAIPFEGDYIRTLWILQELRPGREVIVDTSQWKDAPVALTQYGASLRLVQSDWGVLGSYRVSLYRVEAVSVWSPKDLRQKANR